MVRLYWKGTLVAVALLWGGLAWFASGQPMLLPSSVSKSNPPQQVQVVPAGNQEPIKPVPAGAEPIAAPGAPAATERILTITDPGCPPRQVRVIREWVLADGATAMEVQALDTGEKMTIVCGNCMKCTPEDYAKASCCDYPCARMQGSCSKIFKWGRDCCAPADCPKPPLVAQPCPPPCGPACGPVCGPDGCKSGAKGSLSDMTDKRFMDPCTGKFDYEKYLAELRARHGDCGPNCGPSCAAPAPAEPIKMMPGNGAAKGTIDESKWPILSSISSIVGRPLGVQAKPVEAKPVSVAAKPVSVAAKPVVDSKSAPTKVTTLPSVNDKAKTTTKPATTDTAADSTPSKWFGEDTKASSGTFDKDKYIAELRKKYGKDKGTLETKPAAKEAVAKVEPAKPKEVKEAPKVAVLPAPKKPEKPEVKPPTATLPKPATPPAPVVQAKPEPKPAVETAQPTDWRKSWGKTESQVAKTEKAEPKKALPAAPVRPDPLLDPERYAKRPEPKPESAQWKTQGTPSPLLANSPEAAPAPRPVAAKPVEKTAAPAQPVVQVEAPGKASTAKVPMGARSALAAYGDLQPGQTMYLPVPMVTMPPNAHMVKPPQVAENLPPQINQAFVNAFSGPDAPVMPAGQDPQMAQNAFGNNPMMMQQPMGYPGMPMMPPGMMPPNPMMQQAMMQQAMMQQAMMQQAMMQQGMGQPGMPMMAHPGGAQAGYYPMAAPVQPYQQPNMDPHTAQHLMQTLRESIYPSQREFAAESLARIDWRTHPQVFDALLTAAREDPAATVRSCCVRCMVNMNVNSALVTMTLQGLKNDADPRVRTEVEQALARMPQQPVKSAVQPVSGRN